jgi:hypothetical protein
LLQHAENQRRIKHKTGKGFKAKRNQEDSPKDKEQLENQKTETREKRDFERKEINGEDDEL